LVRPQEFSSPSAKYGITIYRLDFKARIKIKGKKEEYKTVLIELQKAKNRDDLLRFRRYLGDNYRKEDEIKGADGEMVKVALPIITVYFLGFPMPPIKTSVVKVNRVYTDLITNRELKVRTEFIEKLTHDSFVILIRELAPKERSELERVLKVFNQSFKLGSNEKLLEISDEEIKQDELLEMLAERLRRGATDGDLLRKMEIEEEVEETLDRFYRAKEEMKEKYFEMKEKLVQSEDTAKMLKDDLADRDARLREQERLIEELKKQSKNKGK